MRFGIGLIALLMGVGLMLWLQADSAQKTMTVSKPAREAAEEISGQSLRGSYDLKRVENNGKVTALELSRIDPRSPLLNMYDIQVGDQVVEIGPFAVKGEDPELMEAHFAEVGHRNFKLTILRGGERFFLENHGAAAKMGGSEGAKGAIPVPTH
jgi:hypothetical protein